MEPNHNILRPPNELPQPQEVGSSQNFETGGATQQEAVGALQPASSAPASHATSTQFQTDNSQTTDNQVKPMTVASDATSGTPIADDADLIEKEWVIRAKSIVTQTKDDPHAQNNEMNKVKADYMKKRYNKDLKVSEG